MKKINMIGQKIGKLTVIGEATKQNKQTRWLCRCECGNETEVLIGNLRKPNPIKSCGLCGSGGKKLDLTGQRFGRLVAIEPVERDKQGTFWLCKCDCGNESIASTINLRSGHTNSCGCYNKDVTAEMGRNTKKYNEYCIENDTVYVTLNNRGDIMLCDLDDWERFKEIKWNKMNNGYVAARRPKTGETIFYHIELMGKREGLVIDHINRNKLDNRKCNLRFVTSRGNSVNKDNVNVGKSGHTGVYFRNGKWEACIYEYKKKITVGRFYTKEEAVIAREEAVEKYYKPLLEGK